MADTFSPEQISQIIEEFFRVVGTRQYIGARYVPIFGRKGEESIEWDNSAPYEPLTIVLYQGNSYTSRQYVPAGVAITDTDFWAQTGMYNSQIESYRQEVLRFDGRITDIESALPSSAFSGTDTIAAAITNTNERIDTVAANTNARIDTVDDGISTLESILPSDSFSALQTVQDKISNDLSVVAGVGNFIYVNRVTGDDSNDGSNSNTPFKTLSRAFEYAREINHRDLRIYINAAGTYDMGLSRITNAQVHIFSTVPDVTIHCDNLYVYNSYLHLEGAANDARLTVDFPFYHQDVGAFYLNFCKFTIRRFYNTWIGITFYSSDITFDFDTNQSQTLCKLALSGVTITTMQRAESAFLRLMGCILRQSGNITLAAEGNVRSHPVFYFDGGIWDVTGSTKFIGSTNYNLSAAIVHLEHAIGFASPAAETEAETFSAGIWSGRGVYLNNNTLIDLSTL